MTIGLLNEKSLHSALKHWYAKPGDRLEFPLDGYIVDILRGDQVIEIQTGNFSSIKHKMRNLSCRHRVSLFILWPTNVGLWRFLVRSKARSRDGSRQSVRL